MILLVSINQISVHGDNMSVMSDVTLGTYVSEGLGDDYDNYQGYDDGSRYQDLGTVATIRR